MVHFLQCRLVVHQLGVHTHAHTCGVLPITCAAHVISTAQL